MDKDKNNYANEPDKLEKSSVKDIEVISKSDVEVRRADRISVYREEIKKRFGS